MALENNNELEKKIRDDCWVEAKQCFGYSYIYSKKALINQKLLNIIKILGLIIPFIIGISALGGMENNIFSYILYFGIILMGFQAIISAWALFSKWDDMYVFFIEAKIDRGILSSEFKELGKFSAKNVPELKAKYDILKAKLRARENQDAKYEVKEWELRMGMRATLREFQGTCTGCMKKPLSLESSDCDVCGNFNKTYIYKIFKL